MKILACLMEMKATLRAVMTFMLLLGEPVLRRADVMADPYVDEERSEDKQVNLTSPHDGFLHVSSLDDTYTEDHCIKSITEGERQHSVSDSKIEVRKPKDFSVIGVN